MAQGAVSPPPRPTPEQIKAKVRQLDERDRHNKVAHLGPIRPGYMVRDSGVVELQERFLPPEARPVPEVDYQKLRAAQGLPPDNGPPRVPSVVANSVMFPAWKDHHPFTEAKKKAVDVSSDFVLKALGIRE